MNKAKQVTGNIMGWVFGALVVAIGLVNVFWGNDLGFGVFLLLLSLVYFPPVMDYVRARFGIGIPVALKIALGVFIIWAALGVGELFDKVDLMLGRV